MTRGLVEGITRHRPRCQFYDMKHVLENIWKLFKDDLFDMVTVINMKAFGVWMGALLAILLLLELRILINIETNAQS